jgi:hypothetical protein
MKDINGGRLPLAWLVNLPQGTNRTYLSLARALGRLRAGVRPFKTHDEWGVVRLVGP